MYQIGQKVVYGIHGVCVVIGTETKRLDRKEVSYLVLEPIAQPGARYYVPSSNPAALAKLRPLIDRQALDALLRSDLVRQNCWIDDENKRKILYRELITSGDRQALLQMVYTLHAHKKELSLTGRKFHLCDENFLHDAQKLLDSEFACVLQIPTQRVCEYIESIFDAEK